MPQRRLGPFALLALTASVACGRPQVTPPQPQPRPEPPALAGCPVLPADHIWNTPISDLPLDPRSDAYVASIGGDEELHADFGAGLWEGEPIGIPFVVAPERQPAVPIRFDPEGYAGESDPGPFPIPPDAPIEGGPDSDGDRHVLVVEPGECTLYELYNAWPDGDGGWTAHAAARFDLRSHTLRPAGWTSADAAGLPILPGLVRREEVEAGEIAHALRFTAPRTRRAYLWPARHFASDSDDPALPPMGLRFRLRADFDSSSFSEDNQVILTTLKTYGMVLADNGGPWFLSGAPDAGWDDEELHELGRISGTDFEAVDQSGLMLQPDSGQARP
jgi:hypothetical protein